MPVALSVVEKWDDGTPHLREIAVAYPDASGYIGRMAFAPVEMETMAVVHVGDQWDLWIARGTKQDDEDAAREHLRYLASTSHSAAAGRPESQGLDRIIAAKNVRITRQGCERVLFRQHFKILTDYEPPGKCIPWIPPAPEAKDRRIKERFSVTDEGDEDYDMYGNPKKRHSNASQASSQGGAKPFKVEGYNPLKKDQDLEKAKGALEEEDDDEDESPLGKGRRESYDGKPGPLAGKGVSTFRLYEIPPLPSYSTHAYKRKHTHLQFFLISTTFFP
jgi:hypothetical protein